jgi:uncharacterized protein YaiE (UPF0345 family)
MVNYGALAGTNTWSGANTFSGTVSGLTKSTVGLVNVDNTSDVNKPISTATQAALDVKAPLASPNFTGTVTGVTKAMIGLGNDNTSDVNKPVSTAQQTALNLKANIASPTLTGTTTVSTLSCGNTLLNTNGMTSGNIGLCQNAYFDTHTKAIGISNVVAASFSVTGMQNTSLQVSIPVAAYLQATSTGASTFTYGCNYSLPTIQIYKNGSLFATPSVTSFDNGTS